MIAELLVGSAVTFVSGWSGYVLGVRQRRAQNPDPVQPICHCDHMIGSHVDKTGKCMATVDGSAADHVTPGGSVKTWKQVPCTCQSYSGPELVSMTSLQQMSLRPMTEDT